MSTDPLERYAQTHSCPEPDLLRELDRQTHLRAIAPRMISGHMQGRLLTLLVRMLRPRNILEIGTFTGYSALCLAEGLEEDGLLHTIETDDELADIYAPFFTRSPYGHKIRPYIGSALEIAPQIGVRFDLVFIDGDKREYPDYYRMLLGDGEYAATGPLVGSGSILLADNILWYGKVAEPVAYNDTHTRAILEFNRLVREDNRVENVILPLRDGLNLIRVR